MTAAAAIDYRTDRSRPAPEPPPKPARDQAVSMLTFVLDGAVARYLVYLNRSRLDRLSGLFGGLERGRVERRLGAEVKTAIDAVRRRIEAGDPL